MSEKKIVVPEGMLKAAIEKRLRTFCADDEDKIRVALEAALRWLSENPIVPTRRQMVDGCLAKSWGKVSMGDLENFSEWWQRRMFLAPEPEVPEELKNMLWGKWQIEQGIPEHTAGWAPIESHNAQILEAYKRGKASK